MPEQKVILTIDDQGKITAKTDGFKGEACLEAVESLLEQELNVVNIKKTDEYFQANELVSNRTITNSRGRR